MAGFIDQVSEFCARHTAGVVVGGLAAVTVVVAMAGGLDTPADPSAPPVAPAARAEAVATLAPEAVAECRNFIDLAVKAGVVIDRPSPDRIDVDERLFARMLAKEKDVLAQAVSCDVWQKAVPTGLDSVSIYGARSGKRIQSLTSAGMVRE